MIPATPDSTTTPIVQQQQQRGQRTCGIVGAALEYGQRKTGTSRAPAELRKAGLIERLSMLGHNVSDYGDVVDVAVEDDHDWYNAKKPRTVADSARRLCETATTALRKNDLVITLGGDHSMAFGSVQATLKVHPDACLLWVDAHADLNPPFATPSGNMHGMPVALLMKELQETIWMPEYLGWFDRRISAKNVAYLALRDLDDEERRIIRHLGITACSMHDIDKHGIGACLKKCLDAINPRNDRPIHLSFDVDAVDPTACPSTGTPVPGGLSIREGLYICEEIYRTGMLRSVDIAEVNPLVGTPDDASQTLLTALLLLETCAGDVRDLTLTPQHWLSKIPKQIVSTDSTGTPVPAAAPPVNKKTVAHQ